MEVIGTTNSFDRAVIAHHPSYNSTNAYSISFWFSPINTYRKYNVFNKGAGKVALGHSAGFGDVLWQAFGTGWDQHLHTCVSLSSTNWHHSVVIYDESTSTNGAKKLYVDGTLITVVDSSGIGSDSAYNTDNIAFNATDPGRAGSMKFDDLAIWHRALTTNEVAYLYNGGLGNVVAPYPPQGMVISLQ